MALCALGIAHRNGIQNLDSLQHYQQALPGLQKTLRCPQDLSSDGALLTHFVLLLYEIAAAAPRGSNLWSQHVNQLLRIFVLRSEMYETEPYSFILWWVCNMDTHALICGTSSGELVETILQYNMWPTADNVVRLHGSGDCYDPSTEEARAMPAVLDFNRKIEILACRLGLLRRNLQREAESSGRQGPKMSPSELSERQRKVTDIQQALRRTWTEQMPPYIALGLRNKTLSTRARGIFDNVSQLFPHMKPSLVKWCILRAISNNTLPAVLHPVSRLHHLLVHLNVLVATNVQSIVLPYAHIFSILLPSQPLLAYNASPYVGLLTSQPSIILQQLAPEKQFTYTVHEHPPRNNDLIL